MLNATDIAAVLFAVGTGLLFLQRRVHRRLEKTNAELRAQMEQRAAAQAVLKESEERLALSLESSGLALFDWDIASGKVYLSEQWGAMIEDERKAAVVSMQALQELVHPQDRPALSKGLEAALAGQSESYHAEHRVRTRGGRWKWIASHGKVVKRDAQGRALRLVGTNADITQYKSMQQLKGEFAANIAHELRTPLTAMTASLALVREGATGDMPEDAQRLIDMAYDNSQRLSQLIQNMVDVEKLEQGLLELHIESVDLRSLLPLAVARIEALGNKLGVRFELKEPILDVQVAADSDRLLQVLLELLTNGAKFSVSGEVVSIKTELMDSGKVRISVRDRGPGIPDAFRGKVFDHFAQADTSDSRSSSGAGLGLTISRALVTRMNGSIGFETRSGWGTVFYVELNRWQPPPPSIAEAIGTVV